MMSEQRDRSRLEARKLRAVSLNSLQAIASRGSFSSLQSSLSYGFSCIYLGAREKTTRTLLMPYFPLQILLGLLRSLLAGQNKRFSFRRQKVYCPNGLHPLPWKKRFRREHQIVRSSFLRVPSATLTPLRIE